MRRRAVTQLGNANSSELVTKCTLAAHQRRVAREPASQAAWCLGRVQSNAAAVDRLLFVFVFTLTVSSAWCQRRPPNYLLLLSKGPGWEGSRRSPCDWALRLR